MPVKCIGTTLIVTTYPINHITTSAHKTLPHMKFTSRNTRKYDLPAYWACYIAYGEQGDLSDHECRECDDFLAKWGHDASELIDVSEQFLARSQHNRQIADVCTYTFFFSPSSGVARPAMGRA